MTEPKRTMFAAQALSLAEFFKINFGQAIGNAAKYLPELAAPEGTSTGGGKQAVQPIRLVPLDGGPTVVAGNANQVEGTAELRTYDYLVRLQALRFKRVDMPLDRAPYEAFLKKLESFFSARGLTVKVVNDPPGSEIPARPATADAPAAPSSAAASTSPQAPAAVAGRAAAMAPQRPVLSAMREPPPPARRSAVLLAAVCAGAIAAAVVFWLRHR